MTEVRAGRSRWWAAGLVLGTGLIALSYFLLTRPDRAVLPPPVPQPGDTSRATAAADLLDELVQGLTDRKRANVVALAAKGEQAASRELKDLYSNVQRLGITDLDMRYVDEHVGERSLPAKSWAADIQVVWRLGKYDESVSRLEVTMTFRQERDGATFASARANSDGPVPLWMLDRLAVEHGRRTLVMAGKAGRVDRFVELAGQAVRDVRQVLPDWRGNLVVVVPGSQEQLTRALGAAEGSYAAIAAVTTSVDGSSRGNAVRVFINPPVFAPLGERGAQIVMSHEAAHVATGAAASGIPTWLLEGFADYVALAHVDLPVEVTASQILEHVRREGAPRQLPGAEDFKSENPSLGASYEAAWLACRLIAEEHGENQLIRFYRRAERDGDTQEAFRRVLGTTQAAFTLRWRDSLRRLAQ